MNQYSNYYSDKIIKHSKSRPRTSAKYSGTIPHIKIPNKIIHKIYKSNKPSHKTQKKHIPSLRKKNQKFYIDLRYSKTNTNMPVPFSSTESDK